MMTVQEKRARECEDATDASKRARSSSSSYPPDTICPTKNGRPRRPCRPAVAHLDAIRTELARTSDVHFQAQLLQRFSLVAASPAATTSSAIDFLFSFLQETQTGADSGPATPHAALVVRTIMRGLRHLLATKPAVVQPMIQVDAMIDQLMQCTSSAHDDFVLRREMLHLVLDCLVLARKYTHVEPLVATCVHDPDACVQSLCLRGYLRLYEAGYTFPTHASNDVATLFDTLTNRVLYGASERVQVLAAHVLVVLAALHASKTVPSAYGSPVDAPVPVQVFQVLCLAGTDTSSRVRTEIARSLRQWTHALPPRVVEHAVLKTPVDDHDVHDQPTVQTRSMLSSGVLLSLLEDTNVHVATEASRTLVHLSDMACTHVATEASRTLVHLSDMACTHVAHHWSPRALERTIAAHFDVLGRPHDASLARVWIASLTRLVRTRHRLESAAWTLTSTEVRSLLPSTAAVYDHTTVRNVLHVLTSCTLPSVRAVEHVVHFVLTVVAAGDDNHVDDHVLAAIAAIGRTCVQTLVLDDPWFDRMLLQATAHGRRRVLHDNRRVRQVWHAFRGQTSASPSHRASTTWSLVVLAPEAPRDAASHDRTLATLRVTPSDADSAAYLHAVQRIRTAHAPDAVDVAFDVAATLVRLKQSLEAASACASRRGPQATTVSMLRTRPCVRTDDDEMASCPDAPNDAAARLARSRETQQHCQALVDLVARVYVTAFALDAGPRLELLQLVVLGRMGLVLACVQSCPDTPPAVPPALTSLRTEALRLQHVVGAPTTCPQASVWLPLEPLTQLRSVRTLAHLFVTTVRRAWPTALLDAATRRYPRVLALTRAAFLEPERSSLDARDGPHVHWPVDHVVRFVVGNGREGTPLYVKCTVPRGTVTYHRVPVACVRKQAPRQFVVDHTIPVRLAPCSDPSAFHVTICLGHAVLPGQLKCADKSTSLVYEEISDARRVPICPRTSASVRRSSSHVP
ncbi:hypothetical protein PsorP6_014925 [Peronosclerospora sorghi]|uniref:Uncharacterized protein n=1 Tax=Peronosclerospora sorghi TaxID=230839 RepID=A0ACC0VT20_9STRA|nr:hypothetical protein PsorP6_014925 [Peronosclerospora sorghi]